jgi:hypothetical protein
MLVGGGWRVGFERMPSPTGNYPSHISTEIKINFILITIKEIDTELCETLSSEIT